MEFLEIIVGGTKIVIRLRDCCSSREAKVLKLFYGCNM
jgi:hypothetical protein